MSTTWKIVRIPNTSVNNFFKFLKEKKFFDAEMEILPWPVDSKKDYKGVIAIAPSKIATVIARNTSKAILLGVPFESIKDAKKNAETMD